MPQLIVKARQGETRSVELADRRQIEAAYAAARLADASQPLTSLAG